MYKSIKISLYLILLTFLIASFSSCGTDSSPAPVNPTATPNYGQWNTVTSGTTQNLNDVWSSSGSTFIVGNNGTLLHSYDGTTWNQVAALQTSATSENLRAVWGSSPDDVFIVGDHGTCYYYNGSSWTPMNVGTTANLISVWSSSASDVYVGTESTIANPTQNSIYHYDGTTWINIPFASENAFTGIYGSSGSEIYAVNYGDSVGVNRYFINSWSKIPVGITGNRSETFTDVWGYSSTPGGFFDTIYVANDFGTPFYYDGTDWTSFDSNIYPKLLYSSGVWGSSPNDVYIITNNDDKNYGAIQHYDGSQWTEMASSIQGHLNKIFGKPCGSTVFSVGNSGLILRYQK